MKTKIYVAKETDTKPAPRKEVVNLIITTFKNPRYKKIRKHLKRISIIKINNSYSSIRSGTFYALKNKIVIRDHSSVPIDRYLHTIIHELEHAKYHFAFKYNREAFNVFERIAITHALIIIFITKLITVWTVCFFFH